MGNNPFPKKKNSRIFLIFPFANNYLHVEIFYGFIFLFYFYIFFFLRCASDPTLGFFPQNSTVFGFRYQTFKFVDYSNVFIQCDAFVCLISEKNAQCDRSCPTNSTSTGRRKRDVSAKDIYHVISPPLMFQRNGDVVIDRGDGWEITLGERN